MIYLVKERRALTRANCKWLEAGGEAMPKEREGEGLEEWAKPGPKRG